MHEEPLDKKGTKGGEAPHFEFANGEPGHKGDAFNLKPRDLAESIPEEQRRISHEVYEARNVLKLLHEQKAFKSSEKSYHEFIQRVVQAAEVGCAGAEKTTRFVHTKLASEALEQIRRDIVRRKGKWLAYRYFAVLGACGLVGALIGGSIDLAAELVPLPGLRGYGWAIVGSMVGAWLSVAAARWQIGFDDIPEYVDIYIEPIIRLIFVAILASILALFIRWGFITLSVGKLDLAKFDKGDAEGIATALVIGLIGGMGERALSVELIERTRKVLGGGSSGGGAGSAS